LVIKAFPILTCLLRPTKRIDRANADELRYGLANLNQSTIVSIVLGIDGHLNRHPLKHLLIKEWEVIASARNGKVHARNI
jgi:hypothetical protein